MADQEQTAIEGFLKRVKAAPVEQISVATAVDAERAQELLREMADKGLVDLQPSRKYPHEKIAIGTNKLLRHAGRIPPECATGVP